MADLGEICGPGVSGYSGGFTVVCEGNPASSDGTIDTCEIYPYSGSFTTLEFGVVTHNGSNSLTCHTGHHCSGAGLTAASGACRQFTAPGDFTAFSCSSGEFIASYGLGGTTGYYSSGYNGRWATNGDYIGDESTQTFGHQAAPTFSQQAYFAAAGGNPWYAYAQQ